MKTEEHRSPNGYKTIELLTAINKLAVNDSNKDKIVKAGILESLSALLWSESNAEEQIAAAEGLWILASSEDVKNYGKINDCVNGEY